MTNQYEILGVGTPILDHLLQVSQDYLNTVPGDPYGMELVSYQEIVDLIEKSGTVPQQIAGGSCCNAIKGLTSLGHSCGFVGKVGKGPTGEKVINDLQDIGVNPLLSYSNSPTAHVVCLITPDGKRTCRSFIGAGAELTPDELDPELFQGVKLVHIEGYSLLIPGLTHRIMEYAKDAGAVISFDMGSFEVIESYRELLVDLITEYVTVLFSNEEETKALTGKGPKEGCEELRKRCEIAVVMIGDKGCWVGSSEGCTHYPAYPVKPIDTTGAGDLFASGFLHGYLTGRPLDLCAKFGALTGRAVVQVVGAEIPSSQWAEILEEIESS